MTGVDDDGGTDLVLGVVFIVEVMMVVMNVGVVVVPDVVVVVVLVTVGGQHCGLHCAGQFPPTGAREHSSWQ